MHYEKKLDVSKTEDHSIANIKFDNLLYWSYFDKHVWIYSVLKVSISNRKRGILR
jgi:hypothetical protein